jgi:hypothetical protein
MSVAYYEKQAEGFCNFLASIGIVQNPEQCVPLQRAYLEAKIGRLKQSQKVAVNSVITTKNPRNSLQSMDYSALNNVIGLPNYAHNVKGDKQLDYVRAIASSKGCSI